MTPHDDPERDAWLTQALRHAPDADAAPPSELSDTILRAARNAVKTPQAAMPARTNPLLQLWSWLARPSVAAGFATVMVATLVGVMWWDQPLDDTLPPAVAPAATAERDAAAPVATPPAPEPAEAKAEARVEKEAPRAAARPVPPAPAQAARKRVAEAPVASAADEPRQGSADAAAPRAAAPSAFPAPAPAPQRAAAPAPATANAAKSSGAVARDELGEQRAERTSAFAKSAARATPVIDEPERWRWQRGAGPQPMTPALQGWLAQLDRTARWRPANGAPPPAAAGNVLQLWRDDSLRATIQLGDDAVWLTPADGAPLMAPLAPAIAASLKTSLADATP